MNLYFQTICRTVSVLLFFFLTNSAHALKFEIPEELEDAAEARQAAEEAERQAELKALHEDAAEAVVDVSGGIEADEPLPVNTATEGTPSAEEVEEEGAEAATGIIVGQVFDKESGNPLRGVAILVEGTDSGTVSDANGNYRISRVPLGIYSLSYIKSGYLSATVTEATVSSNEILALDFALPPRPAKMSDEVFELQDFVVTAEEVVSQNIELLALRQQALASINAISSEDMSRFAASDAADALKSVSGVSISGGKYAVVRGLDDRFSTTSLNGIVMPSPDPDRQAVPLDIFPSGLLDNVITQKSYTPDQPGESSGGAINLTTKAFPKEFFFKASLGRSYNDLSTSNKSFRLASKASFQPSPMRFSPISDSPAPDSSLSAYAGNTFSVGSNNSLLGVIAGVTHKEKAKFSIATRNRYTIDGDDALVKSSTEQELSVSEKLTFAILGLGLNLTDSSKLNYTAVFSSSENAAGSFSFREEESKDDDFYQVDAETMEREYLNHQITFDHVFDRVLFGANDAKLSLAGSYSKNSQLEPDSRISGLLTEDSGTGVYSNADKSDPYRFRREMEQDNLILKGDLQLPLGGFELKSGISYEESTRETQQFEWKGVAFEDRTLDQMGTSNPDIIIIPGVLEFDGPDHFASTDQIIETGASRGIREISAGYLLASMRPFNNLQVSGGVRLEETFLEMTAIKPGKITQFEFSPEVESSPIDEKSYLPAVTATYEISPQLKLRLGASETIAKPSFRELNPSPIYNITEGIVEIGNPGKVTGGGFDNGGEETDLLPTQYQGLTVVEVTNLDMRLEWFFHEQDMLAVSFFKKSVVGPIERVKVQAGGSTAYTYFNNENDAIVEGLELEGRLGMGLISEHLENFHIGGNYTCINAGVARSSLELGILPNGIQSDRVLFNQPEYILNAYIGYSCENLGVDMTLSANRVGDQLYAITGHGDIYEEPYNSLNLVISKEITDQIALKFAAKNLLDPSKERSLKSHGEINSGDVGDASGAGSSDYDYSKRDAYKSGRSFSISCSYKF